MPRLIVKLQDYYLEWSTVVDAPTTFGLSYEEFEQFYLNEYGNSSLDDLEKRMDRVNTKGTSSMLHSSAGEVISNNRSGYKETYLTKEEIVEWYCVKKNDPPVGVGCGKMWYEVEEG